MKLSGWSKGRGRGEIDVDLQEGSGLFPGARCAGQSGLSCLDLGTSSVRLDRQVTGNFSYQFEIKMAEGTPPTHTPRPVPVPLALCPLDFFGWKTQ